jgi:uncharacterized membrane protein
MSDPASDQDAATDFEGTDRGAAERLTFFSDAVVAIAITLLAIELQVPEGETAAALAAGFAANWGEYLAFLISFAVIARHWISHHRLYRYVGRADTGIIWLNMFWLLLIVLTPFLTRFISEEHIDFPRFGIYALAQTLQTATFAAMVLVLRRTGAFIPETPRYWLRGGWVSSAVTAASFLVSIPLFPLMGSWAFALWVILPFLGGRLTDAVGLTGKGVD